jgi:hypothetical protein
MTDKAIEAERHPIQPLVTDAQGVLRFKQNAIIGYLFESGLLNLNQIALMDFSQEDRQQVAQLLGYSLSGYGGLSYVDDEAYEAAEAALKGETP